MKVPDMGRLLAVKNLIAATGVAVGIALSGTALAVPHTGEILGNGGTNIGGILFSSIHKSNLGCIACANGFLKPISGDIAYEWNPGGAPVTGSTQLFDRGPVTVTTFTVGGSTFSMDLWTGLAAIDDVNFLRATGPASGTVNASNVSLGTFTDLQFMRGKFQFEITETVDNNVVGVLRDNFVFNYSFDMGSVDKSGINADGVIGTFLWGYTSGNDELCSAGGNCSNILSTVYGSAGLGIDIAYSGLRTNVPEPGTMTLFGIGLLGMGLAARRRRSA